MSESQYTPATDEVRNHYLADPDDLPEFDRWLALVERKSAVEALREAGRHFLISGEIGPANYVFSVAERIERG